MLLSTARCRASSRAAYWTFAASQQTPMSAARHSKEASNVTFPPKRIFHEFTQIFWPHRIRFSSPVWDKSVSSHQALKFCRFQVPGRNSPQAQGLWAVLGPCAEAKGSSHVSPRSLALVHALHFYCERAVTNWSNMAEWVFKAVVPFSLS